MDGVIIIIIVIIVTVIAVVVTVGDSISRLGSKSCASRRRRAWGSASDMVMAVVIIVIVIVIVMATAVITIVIVIVIVIVTVIITIVIVIVIVIGNVIITIVNDFSVTVIVISGNSLISIFLAIKSTSRFFVSWSSTWTLSFCCSSGPIAFLTLIAKIPLLFVLLWVQTSARPVIPVQARWRFTDNKATFLPTQRAHPKHRLCFRRRTNLLQHFWFWGFRFLNPKPKP